MLLNRSQIVCGLHDNTFKVALRQWNCLIYDGVHTFALILLLLLLSHLTGSLTPASSYNYSYVDRQNKINYNGAQRVTPFWMSLDVYLLYVHTDSACYYNIQVTEVCIACKCNCLKL